MIRAISAADIVPAGSLKVWGVPHSFSKIPLLILPRTDYSYPQTHTVYAAIRMTYKSTHRWLCRLLAISLAALANAAAAIPILDISTGIDDHHTLIIYDTPDDDWSLIEAPSGVPLASALVVRPSRTRFADLEPEARWISANYETNYVDAPWGLYTYQISFLLDFRSASSFSIEGEYAADNRLMSIYLNGHTAFTGPHASGSGCPATGCEEFLSATHFLIAQPNLFVDGLNVMRVVIENQGPTYGNPTSWAMHAYINAQTSQVSEPHMLSLVILGLLAALSLTPTIGVADHA